MPFPRLSRRCLLALLLLSVVLAPGVALQQDNRQALLEALKLGHKLVGHGELAAAVPQFETASRLAPRVLGVNNPHTAVVWTTLAKLYLELGLHPQAAPLLEKSLALLEKVHGPDHPRLPPTLDQLAHLHLQMGQFHKVEPLYLRALKIRENQFGADHPEVADSLSALGALYQTLGQFAKAEQLQQRCLKIREERNGPDRPTTTATLNDLGHLYFLMGRLDRAESYLQKSLQARKGIFGLVDFPADHPEVARNLHNLAQVYLTQGHPDKARAMLEDNLSSLQEKLGENHPMIGIALNTLATVYLALKRAPDADKINQRALEVWETHPGQHHLHAAESLKTRVLLEAHAGRWDRASTALHLANRLLRQFSRKVLPILAEPEQLAFLATRQEAWLHFSLSFGLLRRQDPNVRAQSAEWLLNARAIAQEALAERYTLARNYERNPTVASLVRQLGETRHRMATLSASFAGNPTTGQKQLEDLAIREQELSKQLGQAGGPTNHSGWVDLGAVQKALPAGSVLIEMARIVPQSFVASAEQPEEQAPRYVAWVIPPLDQGEVQLVELGDAEQLEKAVAAVRRSMVAGSGTAREALKTLAQGILHPLHRHIASAQHWLISPDANLWLVPWSALLLPNGKHVLDKHRVSYLITGRHLLRPRSKARSEGALVLADPDYDLGVEPAERGKGKWKRLPGTGVEARAILPRLRAYTGLTPRLFLGKEATKSVFTAARKPQLVVFSTHGYLDDRGPGGLAPAVSARGRGLDFLPEPARKKPRTAQQPAANPLLGCGLVLAGANRTASGTGSGDDGLLLGVEIVGADLEGTELVVLSACKTGLGVVQQGEGVSGLRQAFHLAGARSIIATLWDIPDNATAELMSTFFERLAAGVPKAEALRQAQLSFLQERVGRQAHPHYWAAFTLTGEWR